MKDKAGWMLSVRRQHSGSPPALFIFHIGVVWPSPVMRTGVTVLFGVLGQSLATVSLDSPCSHTGPYTATVCSDVTWTVKVRPCWHICVSLPETNSYYICLLFSRGKGSRQESNALLKTLTAVTAGKTLTASPQRGSRCWFSHGCSKGDYKGSERDADDPTVAECQCLH